MKKQLGLVSLLLLVALTAEAGEWGGQGRELKIIKKSYVVLTGETVYFQVPGAKLTCSARKDGLRSLGTVAANGGSRCGFVAEKPGAVEVVIQSATRKLVTVEALSPEQVPVVTVSELLADPMRFRDGLFALRGDNRGWGAPAGGVKLQGNMISRSDWIIQDDTGAMYVTGSTPPAAGRVLAIGAVRYDGKTWAFNTLRVLDLASVSAAAPQPAEEVELKGDRANELRVGQVGVIKVFPNKSEVVTYNIGGEAVALEADTRDEIKVRAVKPGEVEVKVWLRWFNDGYGIDGPEPAGSTDKPTMVVKITVAPAELTLKPGVVNEMRPGQIAVIPVWNSKSTWAEPQIKGDAVTVVPGELNEIRLRAEKPGEAEVQVFMRFWNQDLSSAIVGNETPQKPEAVYRIKVVAP